MCAGKGMYVWKVAEKEDKSYRKGQGRTEQGEDEYGTLGPGVRDGNMPDPGEREQGLGNVTSGHLPAESLLHAECLGDQALLGKLGQPRLHCTLCCRL